ncbi:MAG: hypothetical protein E7190_09100 [Erysipelotrichaceae bacterium]|nr:hypothetical protein [Erysipelotrichaceae bacterium]
MEKYPDITLMSDRELLEELVESQRRAEKSRRIWLIVKLVIAAAILILLAIYVPKAIAELNRYRQVLDTASVRMDEAYKMAEDMKELVKQFPNPGNGYEGLEEIIDLFVQRLVKTLNPFR